MTVWQKIKNWFKGTSKKNSSYTTSKKGLSSSTSTTTSSTKKNNNADLKKQLAKQKAEQEAKKKRLQEAFKAKESKVTTKAQDSNYKNNGGADKVLKKIQQKATQDNSSKTSKKSMASNKSTRMPITKVDVPKSITDTTGIKVNNNILQNRKDYTTNGVYDPAKSITRGNETSPILSAALRGGIEGSTLGISELLYKNARPDVAEALRQQEENYTKAQNRANIAGNLVGNAVAFGATSGLGRAVGANIVNKSAKAESLVKGLSNSNSVAKYAIKHGKSIADISAKVEAELIKDLGLHVTTENVQAITQAIDAFQEKDGAFIDKLLAGVGSYAGNQALNSLLNVVMDASPMAVRAVAKKAEDVLADKRGALTNITELTEARKTSNDRAIATLENYIATLEKKMKSATNSEEVVKIQKDILTAKRMLSDYTTSNELGKAIDVDVNSKVSTNRKNREVKLIPKDTVVDTTKETELGLPKGKANVKVKQNQSVRLAEKKWNEAIDLYSNNDDASKLPKWIRESIDDSDMSKEEILDILNRIKDENLKATREVTGKKDIAFGGQPRREAFEKANAKAVFGDNGIKAEQPKTNEFAGIDEEIPVNNKQNINLDNKKQDKIYQEDKWDEYDNKLSNNEPLPKGFDEAKAEKFEDNFEVMDDTKFSKKTTDARRKAEGEATGEVHINKNKRNATRGEYEIKLQQYESSLEDGTKTHIQKHAVQMYGATKNDAARKIIDDAFDSGKYVIEAQNDKEMARKAAEWAFNDLDDAAKEMENLAKRRQSKLFQTIDDISKIEWQTSVLYDIAQENMDVDPKFFGKVIDDCVTVANDIGTEWGRVGRVQQMIARSTPEGAKKITETSLENGLAQNADYIKKYGDIKKGRKLKKVDPEKYREYVKDMYEKFKADPKNKDVVEAIEDIASNPKASKEEIANKTAEAALKAFSKQKRNLLDVLTTARYVAMLSSPKTHVRNVVGNVVRGTMGGVSDTVEQMMLSGSIKSGKINKEDILFRKKLSLNCATESHLKNPKSANGKWAKELADLHENELLGNPSIETKINDSYVKDKSIKDIIKDKNNKLPVRIIDAASEIENKALTKEDKMSLLARYRSCAQKLKNSLGDSYDSLSAQDKKYIDNLIHERAKQYAQDATYRLPNEWANYIKKLSRKATDASATKFERTLGTIVNTIMPFAQTPANVVKTVLDFSPKGFIEGSQNMKSAVKAFDEAMAKATTEAQKNAARREFTMAINEAVELKAKGLTGTALIAIGGLAGALATDEFHFTTNLGNDEESKIRKDWGEQDYSLVFTASNGNQYSVTLDWLSPMATSLFMGVEIGQMWNDIFIEKDFKFSTLPAAILSVSSRIIEPTMDTTMFQSLKSTLETVQNMNKYNEDGEKIDPITAMAFKLAVNYAGQFSPSVVQQITRACSQSDFLITGKNNTNYQLMSLVAKTPLAGAVLGGKTNGWGELKNERNNDRAWALESALRFGKFGILPANVNKITADETDKALLKLAKKTDNWDIMPTASYKTDLNIGRNPDDVTEYELNSKELSVYNQAKKVSGEDVMRAALDSVAFNRYEKQGNKKVFVDGYTEDEKDELIKWSKGKTAKEVVAKIMKDKYFKSATDAEKTKMLKDMLNASTDESKGAKRTSELAVAKAKGMSEDSYNFKNELTEKQQKDAQQYIESGLLTEADFVNFSRDAAKKYYYETEDGGYEKDGFTKANMLETLNSSAYSNLSAEQKAALFNTYKAANAKAYGSSSGRGGYRRSGGSKSKSTKSKISISAYNNATYKPKSMKSAKADSSSMTDALDQALENMQKQGEKKTPPKNKEFKL